MSATTDDTQVMTNNAFADAVGCDFTMASRLRNGQRLPGIRLMIRIQAAFDLPYDDLMQAYEGGPESFGAYLRTHVFEAA